MNCINHSSYCTMKIKLQGWTQYGLTLLGLSYKISGTQLQLRSLSSNSQGGGHVYFHSLFIASNTMYLQMEKYYFSKLRNAHG